MTYTEPHKHWRVAVETSGELIVAIETEMLAGREPSEQDEATIEAAARHLLSFIGRSPQTTEGRVRVKPLEWKIVIPDQVEWAFLPIIGKIQVEPYGNERWEVIWSMPGQCDKLLPDVFADIDSAKAAAQADFERRILAALEPADTGTIQALAEKAGDGTLRAMMDVINERYRQISVEGWKPEHDRHHSHGELAVAAASYALNTADDTDGPYPRMICSEIWPFEDEWWKPDNPRRDLVKAAALILAEIERLDRAEKGGEA